MKMKKIVDNYKKLSNYSNNELYLFIENNENTEIKILGAICSEILKRMINKEFVIKKKAAERGSPRRTD